MSEENLLLAHIGEGTHKGVAILIGIEDELKTLNENIEHLTSVMIDAENRARSNGYVPPKKKTTKREVGL